MRKSVQDLLYLLARFEELTNIMYVICRIFSPDNRISSSESVRAGLLYFLEMIRYVHGRARYDWEISHGGARGDCDQA